MTSSALSGTPDIEQLYLFKPLSGSNKVISAADNKLWEGTTTLSDITGAVAVTANKWKFVTFNGACYGLQASHALVKYTGSGNFANVTAGAGSVPDGNELLSAFGRLWGTSSDGQTVKYCALLDATTWSGVGAGSINFTSVWGNGADEIVALAAFNSFLVVFGKHNIIVLADGSGSSLGLDPANIQVVDMVSGIGCYARDSVQNVNGDDLVFLSYSGVQSLNRIIQERSNPLRDITLNNRDFVKTYAISGQANTIRSCYSPGYGMYLLALPGASRIFCFDTKVKLPDGSWRMTEWEGLIPKSLISLESGNTIYGGYAGKVFQYSGYQDNGSSYTLVFESGWMNFGDEINNRLKFLKRVGGLFIIGGTQTLVFKWAFDFSDSFKSFQKTITYNSGGGEYGIAEYGEDEFGGSSLTFETDVPGSAQGQFIKVGVQTVINGYAVTLQNLQLFTKIGRLA